MRIPFVEHASRESRVALPPKGRLRHYRRWLKAHMQGLDWLPSLRTAKREEVEALEENEEVQALRAEIEQAQTIKERFR